MTVMMEHPSLADTGAEASTRQVVGFKLGDEEYGIEITAIQEIILVGEITRIPEVPDYIVGLINLRGSVVPIIDLRKRLGMPAGPATESTRIIVLNIKGKTLGAIVDAVTQVTRISHDQMDPAPPTVGELGKEHIVGLAKLADRLLIVLEVKQLIEFAEAAIPESR